jgi:hypothetical protein
MTPDGKAPLLLKPGNSWIEVVRCCEMYGVEVHATPEDVQGTATFAAMTATAKAPRLPANRVTQTAAVAAQTNAASAATAGLASTAPGNGVPGSVTATPLSVGMLIGEPWRTGAGE